MKTPEMILFDYGNTLCCEPDFSTQRAVKELTKHVISNPEGHTPEEISRFSMDMFRRCNEFRRMGCEVHEFHEIRLLTEYLSLGFDMTIPELEELFWTTASPGGIMPRTDELLRFLSGKGIRTAVISNIGFSGEALTRRIDRLLPGNRFEFIIASSEYVFRKPDPILFELALKKARISADRVWFCGDNISADIMGAHSAGIFPVHYDNTDIENPFLGNGNDIKPDFDYLHIKDWGELIAIL